MRSKRRCAICVQAGDTEPKAGDVAHIVPLAEGGVNTLDNLVFLCTLHHRQLDQKSSEILSLEEVRAARDKLYELIENKAKEVVSEHPKVFLIHGHDEKAKDEVIRFLPKVGLEAIMLSEQPSFGWTTLEKLERYRNIDFAIAILDPEDLGTRVRQNVVFELGYFVGRLGRGRVFTLIRKGVEIPSSLYGATYIEMDERGVWQEILRNEFIGVGLPIEKTKLEARIGRVK